MTSGGIGIRVDESTDCGIVVTALEVIEPSLSVVIIATVAQRVHFCHDFGVGDGGVGDVGAGDDEIVVGVGVTERGLPFALC